MEETISIQCDWEDFIEVPHKSIWVSRKSRSEPSEHGNIRGALLTSDNENFTVTLAKNSLSVRFNPTGHTCHFIPAFKVFQKKNDRAVVSLDVASGGLGVFASKDNTNICVWDSSTGEVCRELRGHVGDVYKCRLFPSGVVVLSTGSDMQTKIWSAETGCCARTLIGHTKAVMDLVIIDRGRNIISISRDGTARLWNCGDGSCIGTVFLSTDELACCDVGIGTSVVKPMSKDPREVGTDDKILIVGSEQGNIFGVRLADRHVLFSSNCSSQVNAVLYFSQERFIVGTQAGQCLVYDLNDCKLVKVYHESNSPVLSLARFLDKGFLLGRYDGSVEYLNIFSDTCDRVKLTGSDCDPVYSIAITNEFVFTGSRDGRIRKYKISDILSTGV